MFVTYPQSGNGQRQVMSDHCRNMFLSFHLVVVSRDPRGERSLSLSQAIGSRNKMLLRSDGCFPSSPRLAALLTRLRWWLLVMDEALAWLCQMRIVEEDQ